MAAGTDATFRHPFSPRSRVFRATAALLLVVLLTRLLAGWQTHRAVSAAFDDLRRQGQPAIPADVVFVDLPDSKNAWTYFNNAILAMAPGVDSPAASNLDYAGYPPFPPEWWTLAEASEKAHAKAFPLARQARQFPRARILTGGLTSPVFSLLLPHLSPARHLANTLADGALYAHLKGNDPEALDRVLDTLHLGRSVGQDGFLVSKLVSAGITALALHRIQVMAPGLNLQNPATRDRAQQLLRQLLDEDEHRRRVTDGIVIEQLASIDTVNWLSDSLWVVRPVADRQILRNVRSFQQTIAASRLPTQPQVDAAMANVNAESDPSETFASASASFSGSPRLVPRYSRSFNVAATGRAMSRYLTTTFRLLAERRLTVVSLAVQLYRADHGGAFPAQLTDLVPTYLSSIPLDPYHDDGRPIGYAILRLPDGSPRPVLYTDPPGAELLPIPAEPCFDFQADPRPSQHPAIRQYRDLSRFAPPPRSPKAVEEY